MEKKTRIVRLFRIIMPLVAISCMVVFVPWTLVRAWVTPLPDTVEAQVEKAVDLGLDGIIVYVDQAGIAPELYAAGWKNKGNQEPANPEALFKIASISKLYIAVAAAKLIGEGRLSLDDTLAEHLPHLVGRIENSDQITMRMLLQHRSGIPNFTHRTDFPWFDPPAKLDEYLAFALDKPADFAPDARYSYSNTNYLLIGNILDQTLGYSHHQYIQEEIVSPLGLTRTYSLLSEVNLEEVVSGYYVGYDDDLKNLNYIAPGGSMVATVQDVGVFLRALNDGSLLSEHEQEIYASVYSFEHTGLLPGYQSIARYHKEIDTVVIQFVSTSGGTAWTTSEIIYNGIVKILSRQ